MNMGYYIFKLVAGVVNIGMFFYLSVNSILYTGFKWWNIVAAIILVFLVVAGIPIIEGHESTWVFVIVLFSTIPFNIRVSSIIVNWYLGDFFFVTNFMLKFVIYMSLLSVEEILLGVFARIIWPEQQETFS